MRVTLKDPLQREGQLRLAERIVDPEGDGHFHTLIVALPEEEKSHAHPIPVNADCDD